MTPHQPNQGVIMRSLILNTFPPRTQAFLCHSKCHNYGASGICARCMDAQSETTHNVCLLYLTLSVDCLPSRKLFGPTVKQSLVLRRTKFAPTGYVNNTPIVIMSSFAVHACISIRLTVKAPEAMTGFSNEAD